MSTMKRSLGSAVLALGVAAGLSSGALAQATAPSAAPPPMAAPAKGTAHDPATVRVERQIARLHKQLKITDAQAAQWAAFTQVMRDNAQHMETLYAQRMQDATTRSAVQDMQSYAELAKAHAEDVQRLVKPFADLYAAMSDSQKQAADAVFQRAEGNRTPGGAQSGVRSHG